MVVGADGTPPARAAGRALPRLLRTVIVTAGLAALGWLLSTLLATGTAAAESIPDTRPPGLLGGLTHLLGATADTTPASPPGDTAATRPAPADPIVAAPQTSAAPTPAPASVARVRPRPATATRPAPATKPGRTAAVAHRSTPAPAGQAATATASSSAVPATTHTGRKPAPDRAPSAPPAPNSSVSAGHDGPGQARGGTALPAGLTVAVPPAGPRTDLGRASLAGSRTAGLPAMSPD